MRIAIVGTGIAGNVAAYKLRDAHDITVFEAASYVGGHTNTVDVYEKGRAIPIDTGFIVFNDTTYPCFNDLLDEVGQDWQPSEMSFSIRSEKSGLEYSGSTLNTLFAQRRNLLRPSFYRMIADILRFNREAPRSIETRSETLTIGQYLERNNYGRAFIDEHLVPMIAAIWSAEPGSVLEMPLAFLLRFFANHGLLRLSGRPQWRVVEGGSRAYVQKLVAGHRDRIRLNCPVTSIRRIGDSVEIGTRSGDRECFDAVFLACHSDQALALLEDPTASEQAVLGAITYQANEAVLHTDIALMPQRRLAWAAWNYHVPENPQRHVAVTYNMNILQNLEADQQYLVTLNNTGRIDPDRIIRRVSYEHPVYSVAAVAAQSRQAELNCDRTFYCGAYWRNGFHEDGVVSALAALEHFSERTQHGKLHLRRAS